MVALLVASQWAMLASSQRKRFTRAPSLAGEASGDSMSLVEPSRRRLPMASGLAAWRRASLRCANDDDFDILALFSSTLVS